MPQDPGALGGSRVPKLERPEYLAGLQPAGHFSDPGSQEPSGSPLLKHLGTLRRRKWLLLAVTTTTLAVAALELYTVTPLYRATARLQLDPEALDVLPYQELDRSGQRPASRQYLMTQLEKLRSHELALRVVDKLNLGEDVGFQAPVRSGRISRLAVSVRRIPSQLLGFVKAAVRSEPDLAETVQASAPSNDAGLASRLRAGIGVRLVGATRLVEVSYMSPIPEIAAKIANAVADEFVTLHLESRYQATTKASEFLQRELEELEIKVEQSEAALLAYAEEKAIVSLGDKQTIVRKKLADLTDELTRVESRLISERALLQSLGGGEFPELLRDEQIRALESQLLAHKAELAETSSRYGPEWPTIKALNSRIEALSRQLDEAKRQAVASARQEYALTRRHYERLEAAVAEQREIVARLDSDSIQFNILKREAESNEQLYKGLLLRLKEANVEAGLDSSNIQVVELAIVPRAAATPRKMQGLGRALMVGLLLGIAAVALAEMLDRSVKTPEDIQEGTGLPTLGVVPALTHISSRDSDRKSRRLRRVPDPRPILAAAGTELLRGHQWEAYRSLRTSLLLSASEHPPRVILVTSPGPAEGKTTTATNLALALAQTGERTLLLELDMRKPVLASALNLPGSGGVSTFLSGNDELGSQIVTTAHDSLFVLPAGPPPPNPPELISSKRMLEGMEFVREHFEHVVLDSPPVLELSDSRLLSRHADGVMLVARAGRTPKPALRKASEQLLGVAATILGVVLNDSRPESGGYEYYRYYGGYYEHKASSTERRSGPRSA